MSQVDALLARGWKTHQANRFQEAEDEYRQALKEEPDNTNAWCFLGMVCHDTERYDEALEAYRRALELKPDFPVALNNQANTFRSLGRIEEAIESFDAAIALQPDYTSAHYNRALARLIGGDFPGGWQDYEWRWRYLGLAEPTFPQPRWDGSPLEGRRILLHAEQGLGDTLQFIRYASVAKERGGQVVFIGQAALLPLLRLGDDIDEFVPQGDPLPAFDVHASLMSLPLILGTTVDTIPSRVPYVFADPVLMERWRRQLSSVGPFRIGITWQGNPDNRGDRQRSFPLQALQSLSELPGVKLISLQKGRGAEQLQENPLTNVLDFGSGLDEQSGPFMDTAAILQNLDLVVTADTALAHLAGSLGVPTWVVLPFAPDWRWLLKREDSSWYPTMRLFRQPSPGDWDSVFKKVVDAVSPLATLARNRQNTFRDRRLAVTGFNSLSSTRHGLMLYNRHDVYIGKSLERYGEFSEGEVEIFQQIVRPDDVVVEAGANIGTHTVPLSQRVGNRGAVWAFEPQRIIFQTLCANLALNSLSNVFARQAALGAAAGSIVVPPLDYTSSNNFGGLGLGNYEQGEVVPVITIDSLSLNRLNLLKVDVEGMELQVLQGAVETIRRHRPLLYVENDRPDRSAPLIQYLESLEYRLYWHLPPMYRPQNFFQNSRNYFGRIISVNMLCVHQSVAANIQGLRPVEGPHWRG